ncbi:similar to Saccharomyces cerevisiae YDR057W YOS9 ER quality-control lectin [Maudiozyma barnettii]|uniref:Endoplasmic reticulum lectin n=1 Tax=Maudiozyma barnettii TaxID=61262 RepID=A0A8H2ZG71_9SACH|nr:Yos9p [Kazachstania barnettii]CAB4253105.1 similar to Saccharomyces cerevisiae YDR057W YOS9 ER quality-control lectin [Kazachstania barnettii]CAD1780360.1 similar to Saccharomyces cerevisiae YDR057W YOS9 ER quality-control lectin [Kazachstania barnettii]
MLFCLYLLILYISQYVSANLLAPNEDPNAIDKYTIDYMSPCRWDSIFPDTRLNINNGSFLEFGEDTLCFIEDKRKNPDLEEIDQNSKTLQDLLHNTLDNAVNVLSEVLDGYCIIYNNGFWTYRYCPGNDIVQLHNDSSDPQTLLYTLGKSKPDIKDRDFQLLYNELGYYVSEFVGMGDICDVTGAHRLVEVQYVCGETHGIATIQWIRETKICQYEMQISVPELCDLELLSKNEDKKTANHLKCVRYDDQYGKTDKNIIDLLAEYDPTFLGYGIYFLESLDENKRDTLMYTSDDLTNEIPKEIFDRFGKAFNRMINQKMLVSPNGNPVVNGDIFTWMTEIFDITGTVISKLSIHVSELGKAELHLDNDLLFTEPSNFVSYQSKTQNLAHLFQNEASGSVSDNYKHEEDDNSRDDESSISVVLKLANNKDVRITASRQGDRKVLALEALNSDANFELLNDQDRERLLDVILNSDELKPIVGQLGLEDFELQSARFDDTVLFEYSNSDETDELFEEVENNKSSNSDDILPLGKIPDTETRTQIVYETHVISEDNLPGSSEKANKSSDDDDNNDNYSQETEIVTAFNTAHVEEAIVNEKQTTEHDEL